jgi:hypothetical protein
MCFPILANKNATARRTLPGKPKRKAIAADMPKALSETATKWLRIDGFPRLPLPGIFEFSVPLAAQDPAISPERVA